MDPKSESEDAWKAGAATVVGYLILLGVMTLVLFGGATLLFELL